MLNSHSSCDPVARVLQNGDLLAVILEACTVKVPEPHDHLYPTVYVSQEHLRPFTMVNRLFRQIWMRLMLSQTTFETYSMYDPEDTSDDSMKQSFESYQGAVRHIQFRSITNLRSQLQFFVDSTHSIRYLSIPPLGDRYYMEDRQEGVELLLVDLKKRIVHIRTDAYMDNREQVYIKAIYWEDNPDAWEDEDVEADDYTIENWPRGFRFIRDLNLKFGLRVERRMYINSEGTPLHGIVGQSDAGLSLHRKIDTERIFKFILDEYGEPNITFVKSLLEHPFLQELNMPGHDFGVAKTLAIPILRQANLDGLSMKWHQGHWSARGICKAIQAFTLSSIRQLRVSFELSHGTWKQLQNMKATIQQQFGDTSMCGYVYINSYNQYSRAAVDPRIKLLHELFPNWTWMRYRPDRLAGKVSIFRLDDRVFDPYFHL